MMVTINEDDDDEDKNEIEMCLNNLKWFKGVAHYAIMVADWCCQWRCMISSKDSNQSESSLLTFTLITLQKNQKAAPDSPRENDGGAQQDEK